MPTIRVNGEPREVSANATVEDLLAELSESGLAREHASMAIEVNRVVVPRSTYPEHQLDENDEVEIVTIVGGG